MHCTISGCGDILAENEVDAIHKAQEYLNFFPENYTQKAPDAEGKLPAAGRSLREIVPENQNAPFDMYEFINSLVDGDSFFELKKLFAQEMITGLARLQGQPVGIIANQPKVKGGVIFVDSADKAARFISLCDAFNIPLLFLMDVPGFMIGTKVERAGIIRHGAKFLTAMAEATVPKISVVVRKAYGAGLYAMCGPAFEPDCCLALPSAQIAVMGPEAAVNAVYGKKIGELEAEMRQEFIDEKRQEYRENIDIYRLASELIIDGIVSPDNLRDELIQRFEHYTSKELTFSRRKHGVTPV
jgi:methylmalonyl-CoA decarboxylase subunit alpha